jgi:hypothetical protein
MNNIEKIPKGIKKLFIKLGTCSQLYFHILNRVFDNPKEIEERATAPLAGGILQKGYQCGMLWGASMAAGAESFRRCNDCSKAIGTAITATQKIMESFTKRTQTVNCREITCCDYASALSMLKYMFSGRFLYCFKLADQWAPEAVQAASEGLSGEQNDKSQQHISCASEVVKKLGASDEETVMVAGLAGGLGLSGNACGALSAAIWMNTLSYCRKQLSAGVKKLKVSSNKGMMAQMAYPDVENTFKTFFEASDSKILCHEISGRRFNTIDEHTEFIKNGGCEKIINALTQS